MQNADVNEWGQPVGFAVQEWTPPPIPSDDPMVGRLCRLERLDVERHAADLYGANAGDARVQFNEQNEATVLELG